ncbi:MAG: DNA polymerase III subunit gamma/tau [Gemmataceae bacterium]
MAKKAAKADSAASTPATAARGETYTVLARRYRPQTFAELVGQEPVARALSNALAANRVAHAYLFTGARGVGKTSTARILAKALNCQNGPTPSPCGLCANCLNIASGEDVDVIEMDAASNRGIDEIRDIRNNVQYKPSRGRFKIYIIDEVHMLTKEAFNALLKTLEEPPPHVKFIFATTDVQKVPVTILSRCQRFDFAGIALPRIVEQLHHIVQREGLQADPDALELIARRAGGSMRDAQSLLDQLLAFAEDKLTADQVHRLLGTAGDDRILALSEAILAKNPALVLDQLAEVSLSGLQLGELLDQLIAYWRDLMVVHVGGLQGRDLSVPARHHATLEKQARSLSLDAILAGLDVLSTAKARLRGSNHARTLVEMALIRLAHLADLVPLGQLATLVAQLRHATRGSGGDPSRSVISGLAPVPRLGDTGEAIKKNYLTPASEPSVASLGPLSIERWNEQWPTVLTKLGTMLGGQLARAGAPARIGPNALVFRFSPAYNKEREYCQRPESLARLEKALQELTGQEWKVTIDTHQAEAPTAQADDLSRAVRRSPKEEVQRIALVKRAMEVLGATIHRVDEGFGDDTRKPG